MEPAIPDLRDVPRRDAYAQLLDMQRLLLEGRTTRLPAMATTSALLHHAFGHLWTGFYRVVEPGRLLRVGPYQGSLGCLDIAFGRGVCGTAAAERRTVIVRTCTTFRATSPATRAHAARSSCPSSTRQGALVAVLDIDSSVPDAFDEDDRAGLEALVAWFAGTTYVPTPS